MLTHSKAFGSFSVDDVRKAKRFYGETLGLAVTDSAMGVIELQIEGNNNIVIYPKPDHTAATFTILNFPVNDISEAVEELRLRGVQFEQYSGDIQTDEKGICRTPHGPSIAWFKDPAGNILSIIEEKS